MAASLLEEDTFSILQTKSRFLHQFDEILSRVDATTELEIVHYAA